MHKGQSVEITPSSFILTLGKKQGKEKINEDNGISKASFMWASLQRGQRMWFQGVEGNCGFEGSGGTRGLPLQASY